MDWQYDFTVRAFLSLRPLRFLGNTDLFIICIKFQIYRRTKQRRSNKGNESQNWHKVGTLQTTFKLIWDRAGIKSFESARVWVWEISIR